MGVIKTQDAKAFFRKELTAVYAERIRPTNFFRSMFREKETTALEVSIEVQRGNEKIAVDVERGTIGNRNQSTKSTEKIFVPPYFREYIDMTSVDHYKEVWSSAAGAGVSPIVWGELLESAASKMGLLTDKIDRSVELQCSQILHTGVITLKNGEEIDFKRKSASMVDLGSGNYWADSGVDPITSLLTACEFLRTEGLTTDSEFNMTLGSTALNDLQNNAKIQARGDIKDWKLDMITSPVRNAQGAALHGRISVGSWIINIWTYPQFYKSAAGVTTPYQDPKYAIITPSNPAFVLNYAGVPQLKKDGAGNPQMVGVTRGKFVFGEYFDERMASHALDVQSAPLAVPVGVDQIYTAKVSA